MASPKIAKVRQAIDDQFQRDLDDRRAGWKLTKEHGFHPMLLILANFLVYYWVNVRNGFAISEIDNDILVRFGADFAPLTAKQPWRLVTAMFLHADLSHIVGNMAGLFFAGRLVHHFYGKKRFYLIYFAGGLLGQMVSAFFHPSSICIGASGAVFAVDGAMLAAIVYRWTSKRMPFSNLTLLTIAYGVLNSLAQGFKGEFTNNAVHMGGILAGGALGWAMLDLKISFANLRYVSLGLLTAGLIGLYAGAYKNLPSDTLPSSRSAAQAAPPAVTGLLTEVKTYGARMLQMAAAFKLDRQTSGDEIAVRTLLKRSVQVNQTFLKNLNGLSMPDREAYDFQIRLHKSAARILQLAPVAERTTPEGEKASDEFNRELEKVFTPTAQEFNRWYVRRYGQEAFDAVVVNVPPFEEIQEPIGVSGHESEKKLLRVLFNYLQTNGEISRQAKRVLTNQKAAEELLTTGVDNLIRKTLAELDTIHMSAPEPAQRLSRIRTVIARFAELNKQMYKPGSSRSDLNAFEATATEVINEIKDYVAWYDSRFGKAEIVAVREEGLAREVKVDLSRPANSAPIAAQPGPTQRVPANFAVPSPAAALSCRNSLNRYPRVSKIMLQNCSRANSYAALALDEYTQIYTRGLTGGMQDSLMKVNTEAQLQCVTAAAHRFRGRMTARYLEEHCL